MEEVINIFKRIQSVSSINKKKKIISENSNNNLFKLCLKFLLDNNVVTGISSKKINKNVLPKRSNFYLSGSSGFDEVISYLADNNTGRDEDIYEIQRFLSGHEQDREFYEQMITKTFRLGADAKLVNQCIPELIPTFNVMLGKSIEDVKLRGDEYIFISQKLNGCRCVYVDGKLFTRQGKEYAGLDHIIADIKKINSANFVIDGELLYKNEEGLSDSEAFQKGTGIAMSKDVDKSCMKYVIFDTLPKNEFSVGKSKACYSERKCTLKSYKMLIDMYGIKNLEVVPFLYEGTDHTKIWKCLDYAEDHDWEGVIVNLDTPYECKRTKTLLKVKKFFNADLLCVDVEEGSGKNKGSLGAIICDYKGNLLNVGSGFSDDDRKYYWKHPEDIVGHIVSVKYKEETKNKDGGISVQFPVFEAVRFDKNYSDYCIENGGNNL